MWQISYPPVIGASLGRHLKTKNMMLFWPSAPALASKEALLIAVNHPHCFSTPSIYVTSFALPATSQTNTHHKRGQADFFFQLNLLPPYLLRLQGDKIEQKLHFWKNNPTLNIELGFFWEHLWSPKQWFETTGYQCDSLCLHRGR